MNRLKYLREKNKLSTRKLMEYTGIFNSVVTYLEKEQRPFRQCHIDVLTAFFGVTSDYLLGKSEYGIIVYPENSDSEYIMTETEYLKNEDNIISIIHKNTAPFTFTIGDESVVNPEYQIFRTFKGNTSDLNTRENLKKQVDDLIEYMSSDNLLKTIRFIKDYINK